MAAAFPSPAIRLPLARGWLVLVLLAVAALARTPAYAQGQLDTIRDDVRRLPPTESSTPPADHRHGHRHRRHDCDDDDSVWVGLFGDMFGSILGGTITAPFWGPHIALGDSFDIECYFPRFPYDRTPGYMMDECWLASQQYTSGQSAAIDIPRPRGWAARFHVDYADDLHNLNRVGGRLLLSTASRWGLDTEMSYLRETMPDGGHDELWLGDCNLVFRFAQNRYTQWRTGIGFNWLDDPVDTDYGFNFTYGVDFYPGDPWILSASLDWGTLGRATMFHFRTTAGVTIHGIESYVGYEYYDIDRTQTNSLIAGVGVWF